MRYMPYSARTLLLKNNLYQKEIMENPLDRIVIIPFDTFRDPKKVV